MSVTANSRRARFSAGRISSRSMASCSIDRGFRNGLLSMAQRLPDSSCSVGHLLYRVPVNVCGADVNRETLVYTQASTEIDFVVPDDSDHWVILVPHDRLLGRLDPEFRLAVLRQCHRHMTCSPALAHTLRQFVCHVIDKFARQPELLTDEWVCKSIESQLLHLLVRMMRLGHGIADTATVLDHQSTLRDVIAFLKGRKQPVTVFRTLPLPSN